MKKSICLIAVCVASAAGADPVNLVVNGEFEDPAISGFVIIPEVPGWTSTGGFELWEGGFLNSPVLGSDGEPTGQHLEMDVGVLPTFTQSFILPGLNAPTATFSFDAWERSPGLSSYRVTGTVSGELVPLTPITNNNRVWTRTEHEFNVVEGETITVFFVQGTSGGGASGSHVDQVEFIVDQSSSCAGDITLDGTVDAADLAALLAAWGLCDDCVADLNDDEVVDAADLAALLAAWGSC